MRTRLALLHGLVALLAGGCVLAIACLVVDRGTATQRIEVPVLASEPASAEAAEQLKSRQAAAERQVRDELRARTLDPLVERGLLGLGGVVLAALVAGWFAAGRVLRPIHRITTTARRVADRNLHERIAFGGPRDEWRELADTVDDMLSRLDAAFAGQRQFVGNASHELKTPLAINRTLLEVAMNRPNAPVELRELGETLLVVNARHESLVDGLLTLAQSQHEIAAPEDVDLAEAAAAAVDLTRHEAQRLGVAVSVDGGPAAVRGDRTLLDRLAHNLVVNAVRHNVSGGWVRVLVAPVGEEAELSVANTGPVVPHPAVARLFEPFQRAANRVGSVGGSGLGLSIVRSVVHAHGGRVEAEPRDGGGLVVRVLLPRSTAG
ncbi:ATP-binding protein [Actinosynnema sp. NPDC047251]|uniref:histidine kinase n=1 Tax=Saccharothrix espanaensis (strain ATCC 51144 / DSM 44229 / JCM 9112 / NBRC 15066 / NRRL 15764) TaxID=1179773 RepID=K0JXR2_SACES|nr:ATP-binding protein [Saccharothrix espanaensis]CCH32710.1 Sensor protein, CutS family [Saccharothrix espanaensis DSM 44229]